MKMLKFILFSLVVACTATVNPQPQAHIIRGFIPETAQQYDIPEIYHIWWREISDCAGIHGNLDRIKWYSVGKEHTYNFPCPVGACSGWWRPSHEIYIANTRTKYETTVKHEMLHDLLGRRNGGMLGPHHDLFGVCKVS